MVSTSFLAKPLNEQIDLLGPLFLYHLLKFILLHNQGMIFFPPYTL